MITSASMLALTADMPMRQIDINGRPYLRRYFTGTTADDYDVFVHQFLTADGDRHLHSHPRNSWSLPILGGYLEESPGRSEWRLPFKMTDGMARLIAETVAHPGSLKFMAGAMWCFCREITVFDWHRIAQVEPGTWSLFIVGPDILPFWYFRDGDQLEAVKSSPRDWHKSCLSRRQIEANNSPTVADTAPGAGLCGGVRVTA